MNRTANRPGSQHMARLRNFGLVATVCRLPRAADGDRPRSEDVGSCSQCMRKRERGLSMNAPKDSGKTNLSVAIGHWQLVIGHWASVIGASRPSSSGNIRSSTTKWNELLGSLGVAYFPTKGTGTGVAIGVNSCPCPA